MVVLWILNSPTSLANFKPFKNLCLMICDVYNPFLFRFNNIFILFNYFFCFFRILYFSASLFKSSNCTTSSMIIESNNCFFISSFNRHFAFLLSAKPFHIYKQKIITIVPNLKQKCLSKLIFFCKFRSKKITSSAVIFSLSHSSFKVLSINSWVSGNLLLTVSKTAKAIFSRFLFITTRVCSLIFYYSALRSKNYLKLFYIDSWYMILNMVIERWLVFKISIYNHETLWLVFKISKYCHETWWLVFKISKYGHKTLWLIFKIYVKTRMNKIPRILFKILINYS